MQIVATIKRQKKYPATLCGILASPFSLDFHTTKKINKRSINEIVLHIFLDGIVDSFKCFSFHRKMQLCIVHLMDHCAIFHFVYSQRIGNKDKFLKVAFLPFCTMHICIWISFIEQIEAVTTKPASQPLLSTVGQFSPTIRASAHSDYLSVRVFSPKGNFNH